MKMPITFFKSFLVVFSSLLLTTQVFAAGADIIAGIKNLKTPVPGYFSGGQATDVQLTALANAGVKHIINLRLTSETPNFNEASIVMNKGMIYHHLPVNGVEGLSLDNIKTLDRILKEVGT